MHRVVVWAFTVPCTLPASLWPTRQPAVTLPLAAVTRQLTSQLLLAPQQPQRRAPHKPWQPQPQAPVQFHTPQATSMAKAVPRLTAIQPSVTRARATMLGSCQSHCTTPQRLPQRISQVPSASCSTHTTTPPQPLWQPATPRHPPRQPARPRLQPQPQLCQALRTPWLRSRPALLSLCQHPQENQQHRPVHPQLRTSTQPQQHSQLQSQRLLPTSRTTTQPAQPHCQLHPQPQLPPTPLPSIPSRSTSSHLGLQPGRHGRRVIPYTCMPLRTAWHLVSTTSIMAWRASIPSQERRQPATTASSQRQQQRQQPAAPTRHRARPQPLQRDPMCHGVCSCSTPQLPQPMRLQPSQPPRRRQQRSRPAAFCPGPRRRPAPQFHSYQTSFGSASSVRHLAAY